MAFLIVLEALEAQEAAEKLETAASAEFSVVTGGTGGSGGTADDSQPVGHSLFSGVAGQRDVVAHRPSPARAAWKRGSGVRGEATLRLRGRCSFLAASGAPGTKPLVLGDFHSPIAAFSMSFQYVQPPNPFGLRASLVSQSDPVSTMKQSLEAAGQEARMMAIVEQFQTFKDPNKYKALAELLSAGRSVEGSTPQQLFRNGHELKAFEKYYAKRLGCDKSDGRVQLVLFEVMYSLLGLAE